MQSESVQTALASLAQAVVDEGSPQAEHNGARTDAPPSAPSTQPSPSETQGGARSLRAQAFPVGLPVKGSQAIFPTWLWMTTLSVRNDGSQYGEARVQTVLNADPEFLPLQPGETKSVTRWWGGVPIRVTNNADSPLTAWTV
jgi:hypothetical protein